MHYRPIVKPTYWLGLAVVLLGLIAMPAYAGNILDTVGSQYKTASGNWESSLVPIAKGLFIKLATIELLWSAVWWVMERDDPNQVIVSMLRKIMPLMFFWAILLNFDNWIPAIISSFTQAGETAGNTGPLTPSTVLDRGLEIATTITTAANKIGLLDGTSGLGKYLLAGLSALGILLCFGVIAGQMLVTLIESYIVVSGGVLFLGFAGSRWTTTFAEKYISYAVSVGVKLFVTYLIIGAGQTLSNSWAGMITTDMIVADYLTILVGAMVYMFLAWQIPSLASSMLTGAVSMTLGSAAATVGTMAAGVTGAAGLAQAAAGSTANSVAGAVKAGSAAIDQAKEKGATSLGGIAAGAAGALASGAAGAARDTIKGFGEGSAGGNLAERIQSKTASIREANAAGAPAASVPGGDQGQPAAPTADSADKGAAAAPAAAGGDDTPPEPTRDTPPPPTGSTASGSAAAAPAAPSSLIDTTSTIEQAKAQRDAARSQPAAPAAAPAQPAAPAAQPAADTSAAATSAPAAADQSGGTASAGSSAPAQQPAAPAASPAAPEKAKEKGEPKPNALQKLSEHASALSSVPNDSAAGAGVQINLKHHE